MKTAAIALLIWALGLCCGVVAHAAWMSIAYPPQTVADHWRVVNGFNRAMRDPNREEVDSQTGLAYIREPPEFEPSLHALVVARELECVDLVFPSVPLSTSVNRHWMKWANDHADEVIYATGNQEYAHYQVSGDPPLHLQIWFRPTAAAKVQALISELEALPREPRDS